MSSDKIRIVISIQGGLIDCIASNVGGEKIDLEVIDFDNLESEGKSSVERDAIWEDAIKETPNFIY